MVFSQFEEFVMSSECYEHHDVSYIDSNGLQHYIDSETINFWQYQSMIAQILVSSDTLKVEQIERWFGYTDRTAHAFYNKENGPSFGIHEDPVDVLIECLDGKKWMEVDGKEIALEPHETLYIPANTPHRALNYEKALMISYGINDTETLSRIRENHGNV